MASWYGKEEIDREFLNALVDEGGMTKEDARAMLIDMGEMNEEDENA